MTVAEFLAGDHLRRGDIVLCRGRRGMVSRLVRWATRSHFSHAAMVFLVPARDDGFDRAFLIESVASGVDLTPLAYYVEQESGRYDVAIKRLDAPWFTVDVGRQVRGWMLNLIKATYDYGTVWRLAGHALRRLVFGVGARTVGLRRMIERRERRGGRVPGDFICSGFVQYGYYRAIEQLVGRGQLPAACLRAVMFSPALPPEPDEADLVAVTPEDLARAPHLAWKYVIREGLVFAVSSRREAYALLLRPRWARWLRRRPGKPASAA
jgi:hypothetical protein